MQTSNFARNGSHPQAVAISIGVPPWYRGRRYLPLAPDREWLDLPPDEYTPLYQARLDALDPQQVAQDLGEDAVLLCWEAPDKFCHRFLVSRRRYSPPDPFASHSRRIIYRAKPSTSSDSGVRKLFRESR